MKQFGPRLAQSSKNSVQDQSGPAPITADPAPGANPNPGQVYLEKNTEALVQHLVSTKEQAKIEAADETETVLIGDENST